MSDIILKSSLQENLVKNDLKRNIEDIMFLLSNQEYIILE